VECRLHGVLRTGCGGRSERNCGMSVPLELTLRHARDPLGGRLPVFCRGGDGESRDWCLPRTALLTHPLEGVPDIAVRAAVGVGVDLVVHAIEAVLRALHAPGSLYTHRRPRESGNVRCEPMLTRCEPDINQRGSVSRYHLGTRMELNTEAQALWTAAPRLD